MGCRKAVEKLWKSCGKAARFYMDHPGDHPRDHPGDHPRDHPGDHSGDHSGDHPRDHSGDHPRDHPGRLEMGLRRVL